MIVFHCSECFLPNLCINVLRCPRCAGENFTPEYRTLSKSESQVHSVPRKPHFCVDYINPTIEERNRVIGSLWKNEQNEMPWISSEEYFSPEIERTGYCNEDSFFETERTYVQINEKCTRGTERIYVDRQGRKDSGTINMSSHNIYSEQEQLQNYIKPPNVMKSLFPKNQNEFRQIHSLSFLNYDNCGPLTFNCLPSTVNSETEQSQHLMNLSYQPSTAQRENTSFIAKTNEKLMSEKPLRYDERQTKMDFVESSIVEKPKSMLKFLLSMPMNKNEVDKMVDSSLYNSCKTKNSYSRNTLSELLECVLKVPKKKVDSSAAMPSWPYICLKCLKRFNKPDTLKVHLQSNCNPNPYKCHYCPKRFSHKSHWQIHEQSHTRRKRFKCVQCDYSSPRNSFLEKHIKERH